MTTSGTSTPSTGESRTSSPMPPHQAQQPAAAAAAAARAQDLHSLPRAATENNTSSTAGAHASAAAAAAAAPAPMCHQPQVNHHGNPVSPMERVYPKPEEELDVAEALRRKPLKHTFTHHVQSNKATRPAPEPRKVRADEMEQWKRELRDFQSRLNGRMGRD
ncbi:uncharacterized protein MKZ38_004404 [Zalerion maritima]|uniref:Uncharacterized protein n=1 Tax=Zalerion maritima TaxID=339359 RepID=A0AAD5RMK2_9PEZI|nr:uncharacterized protein MKZ38_004404 [Zalerion maritima]